MALARLWQLLLKIGLLLGKISCLKEPVTGGDGRAAGNFTAANVPAPLGDIGGPGLKASKAFLEFVLSNDLHL